MQRNFLCWFAESGMLKPLTQLKTLEQAQALIEALWLMVREQAAQIERQKQLIER